MIRLALKKMHFILGGFYLVHEMYTNFLAFSQLSEIVYLCTYPWLQTSDFAALRSHFDKNERAPSKRPGTRDFNLFLAKLEHIFDSISMVFLHLV